MERDAGGGEMIHQLTIAELIYLHKLIKDSLTDEDDSEIYRDRKEKALKSIVYTLIDKLTIN